MLTIVMLFCSVSSNAIALDTADAAMSEQTNTPTQEPTSQDASLSSSSAVEERAELQIIQEDVSKRDKFEKHYLCSDGSYVAIVYPEQVNYYDSGEWKEVDNTLKLSSPADKYVSSNADVSAQFSKSSTANELVSLSDGGQTISWRVDFSSLSSSKQLSNYEPPELVEVSIKNPETKSRALSEETITSLDKYSSQLTYSGVYKNKVDLRYSVYYGRVEEDIILNSADALTSYRLTVNTGGLAAIKNEDNSISFNDADGNAVFTIAAPWMKDAASEVSDNIAVTLTQNGNTAYVTYTPDAKWLAADERVFPVLIDPSVTTRKYTTNYVDTYVYTGDSASPTRAGETTMKIGNKNGVDYVAYLKIFNIPTLPIASTFYDAVYLHFYINTNTSISMDLYAPKAQWSLSRLSYANQPTSSKIPATFTGAIYSNYRKCTYDISSYVNGEDLLNGAGYWNMYNYGFKIQSKSGAGVYSEIYASEHASVQYRPVLELRYTIDFESVIADNGVYSFKNTNSGKYLTVGLDGAHLANVYQSTKNNLRTQAFRLSTNSDGDGLRIGTMSNNDGNGNVLYFRHDNSVDNTTGYVPVNVMLGSVTTDYEDRYEWVIYFINDDMVKIVSRADPCIVLTAHENLDGSNSGVSATSAGNVYVSNYTGSPSQHWYIESGGLTLLRDGTNIKQRDFFYVDEYSDGLRLCCIVENFGDGMIWTSSNTSIV